MQGTLSVILHGDSKAGKSTAANTMPAPRLLLDAEKAYRWLPGKKIFWDPIHEEPPVLGKGRTDPRYSDVHEIEWETCVVIVRNWATFERAYVWLNQADHPFKSVIIDSITEIQVNIKMAITNGNLEEKLQFDGWNTMLVRTEGLSRDFRDLTEHPRNPVSVAITAMTEFKDGKWRPLVQGASGKKLPYFFDVIGYVYRDRVIDPLDPSAPAREAHRMLTGFDPNIIAGQRVNNILSDEHKVPAVIENINFAVLLQNAFGS